jgi:hypothetical protein
MEMFDLIKIVSSPDRLRVIGSLAQKHATRMEVAAQLAMSTRQVGRHLAFLERVELVRMREDVYQLTPDALEKLSRRQLAGTRPSFHRPVDVPAAAEKVLKAYLNVDGSLREIPSQPGKRRVILMYILLSFDVGQNYTEKEVNMILKRFHEDHASLRRYLVDTGLLRREGDGSRYWYPTQESIP